MSYRLGVDVGGTFTDVLLPEMREYERALTTVANGYVQPQVARYVANLRTKLRDEGVPAELSARRRASGGRPRWVTSRSVRPPWMYARWARAVAR